MEDNPVLSEQEIQKAGGTFFGGILRTVHPGEMGWGRGIDLP